MITTITCSPTIVNIRSTVVAFGLLTAGRDVTQVHSNLRVQGEAPGCLHLTSWVTAEIVTSKELGIFLCQVMAVRVLSTPCLTVTTRFGVADCAPIVSPTSIVTGVVMGGV